MKKIILYVVFLAFFSTVFFYGFDKYRQNSLDKSNSYNTVGVTDEEIAIASVSALTGHVGFFSEYSVGAKAYIDKINEEGGVNGRKIRLITYDDQYDPEKTVYFTQKAINEDQVFALFNYVGTPTGLKAIPLVNEAQIPLLGLGTGAEVFRQPINKYIFNLRPSYHQEVDAFIKGMVEDWGYKRIAIFYQYDAYGFDGLKGAQNSLARYGLKPVAEASYERGTLNVEEGLKIIKESEPEAIAMVSVYGPAAKFIKLAKAENFKPVFQNLSFVGSEALVKELGAAGNGVVVTQAVPPPTERSLLIGVDDYISLLDKHDPGHEPTFSGLEGFADAEILVEGLRRAGRDLDRDKFMKALESIQRYDLGLASPVSFSDKEHQGMQRVYYTYIKDGKFVLFSDWREAREKILEIN